MPGPEGGRKLSVMPDLPEMDGGRRVSHADTGRRTSQMPGLLDGGPYLLGGAHRVEVPAGFVDRRRRTIGLMALQESIKEKQVSMKNLCMSYRSYWKV